MCHVHDPQFSKDDGKPQGYQRQCADLPDEVEDQNSHLKPSVS
jgi:hypothetical protein